MLPRPGFVAGRLVGVAGAAQCRQGLFRETAESKRESAVVLDQRAGQRAGSGCRAKLEQLQGLIRRDVQLSASQVIQAHHSSQRVSSGSGTLQTPDVVLAGELTQPCPRGCASRSAVRIG
ncbi:MAG: hypothetical protein DLM61_22265 [Pseudonocardiales bacterium]|nr:MAG: hypothetical protein DLM61_22265 [Pseudonocardiales bacterium]